MTREDRFIALVGLISMLIVVLISCAGEPARATEVWPLPLPSPTARPTQGLPMRLMPRPLCHSKSGYLPPECLVVVTVTPPPMPTPGR